MHTAAQQYCTDLCVSSVQVLSVQSLLEAEETWDTTTTTTLGLRITGGQEDTILKDTASEDKDSPLEDKDSKLVDKGSQVEDKGAQMNNTDSKVETLSYKVDSASQVEDRGSQEVLQEEDSGSLFEDAEAETENSETNYWDFEVE